MHCDTEIRVRYAETDQMGVVYHANYFVWFEVARTDLLQAMGYSYWDLEAQGVFFPIVSCDCRYRQPARYADDVTVRSWLSEVRGARFSITYQVTRKADGALLAGGSTTHVFVGADFRPVNMLRVRPDVYNRMKEQAEQV